MINKTLISVLFITFAMSSMAEAYFNGTYKGKGVGVATWGVPSRSRPLECDVTLQLAENSTSIEFGGSESVGRCHFTDSSNWATPAIEFPHTVYYKDKPLNYKGDYTSSLLYRGESNTIMGRYSDGSFGFSENCSVWGDVCSNSIAIDSLDKNQLNFVVSLTGGIEPYTVIFKLKKVDE